MEAPLSLDHLAESLRNSLEQAQLDASLAEQLMTLSADVRARLLHVAVPTAVLNRWCSSGGDFGTWLKQHLGIKGLVRSTPTPGPYPYDPAHWPQPVGDVSVFAGTDTAPERRVPHQGKHEPPFLAPQSSGTGIAD